MTNTKEQFVSNLNGTSIDEIFVLSASTPLLTVVSQLVSSFFLANQPICILTELLVRGVGMVIVQSEFSFDRVKWIVVPLLVICSALLSMRRVRNGVSFDGKRIWALSEYRSAMMWGTVVAILAVDFQLFPRRFAKTEIHGLSLMDLGVGSFVFAAGVVSPIARGSKNTPYKLDFKLCILGLARFVSVWFSGYQSHVSEYGVHWNFFLTLFLLPLIPNLAGSYSKYLTSPLSVLILHNVVVLYLLDGVTYTLHAPRSNFFNQNREGILSLLGYISLYKFGIAFGRKVFQKYAGQQKQTLPKFYTICLLTSSLAMILCQCLNSFMSFGSETAEIPTSIGGLLVPSRRICNAGYVLLAVAYNIHLISLYGLIEHFTVTKHSSDTQHKENMSLLVSATDSYGLYIFLIANLCTGLVNLLMGDATVTASTQTAFCVVSLYTLFVMVVALYLKNKSTRK